MGSSASVPRSQLFPISGNEYDFGFESDYEYEEEILQNEEVEDNKNENGDERQQTFENALNIFLALMSTIQTPSTELSKDKIFQVINEAIDKLEKISTLQNNEKDLFDNLELVSNAFFAFKKVNPLPYDVVKSYQRDAGRLLVKKKIVRKICSLIKEGLGEEHKESNIDEQRAEVIKRSLSLLWNFSDSTKEVTVDIVRDSEFLESFKKVLEAHNPEQKKEQTQFEQYLVKSILGILHNIGMVEDNIPCIRNLQLFDILRSYLESESPCNRLNALSVLANIIDEKESIHLQEKGDAIEWLKSLLSNALTNASHECILDEVIWNAKDCAFIVGRLAKNDVNKKLLVQMGFLDHLVKLMKDGAAEEQTEAAGAIWYLAFDTENKDTILKYEKDDVVRMMFRLMKTSDDKDVRRNCDGALRTLHDTFKVCDKYTDIVSFYKTLEQSKTLEKKGHIMISYNKTHRHVLIRVRNELRSRGYRVWMDIDKIKGSSLNEMYKAVKSAHIVLICVSQAYKDSKYCRSEATCAYKMDKRIVPLRMQQGYEADEWLDMIMGDRIYYDFYKEDEFKETFERLLKEIKTLYRNESSDTSVKTGLHEKLTKPVPCSPKIPVRKWTDIEVENWKSHHKLSKELFGSLTGRDVSALTTMKKVAPECFYNWLKNNLKLSSLSDIDMFMEALSDIDG